MGTLSGVEIGLDLAKFPQHLLQRLIRPIEDGLAWITFNRARARNVVTLAIYEQMAAICEAINQDRSITVLIVGNSMSNISRLVPLIGPARTEAVISKARLVEAPEALV